MPIIFVIDSQYDHCIMLMNIRGEKSGEHLDDIK